MSKTGPSFTGFPFRLGGLGSGVPDAAARNADMPRPQRDPLASADVGLAHASLMQRISRLESRLDAIDAKLAAHARAIQDIRGTILSDRQALVDTVRVLDEIERRLSPPDRRRGTRS